MSTVVGSSFADSAEIKRRADLYQKEVPHTAPPYSNRQWGHSLHSLCSYQGKLKPSLAHFLVLRFSEEGQTILDPLGGVGTVALESGLQGRKSFSNDLSPFASTVAKGKVDPPSLELALGVLAVLGQRVEAVDADQIDWSAADFGLNAPVREYFHPSTLGQILAARQVFLGQEDWSPQESFVWASILHVLHGNRPYALSRRSHPITPYRPTGDFEEKDLIASARAKIERSLKDPLPERFVPGESLRGSYSDLDVEADVIITSPPFIGMRFDRPNWLRLWFCGWSEEEFKSPQTQFLDRQQRSGLDCYSEFFEHCSEMLGGRGLLILHVGSGSKGDMSSDLLHISHDCFRPIANVDEDVRRVERHGIPDKRLTTSHHLLFLAPR